MWKNPTLNIPRIPYPIVAYRYSCDYVHDGVSLLCISALKTQKGIQSKLLEILHPWDMQYGWITDEIIVEQLAIRLFKKVKKIVYAIEDRDVLGTLLWLKMLRYDAEEKDEGSYEYGTLWDNFSDGMEWEIRLFQERWIELISGRDDDLLRLFTWEEWR